MPPLIEERQPIYEELYRLRFLEDGYPGRQVGETVQPHPIYGTYVIRDYLLQHRRSGDPKYLAAAQKVADAALARMDRYRDALVFWYEPDSGLGNWPKRYYSGLTQARYIDVLERLYRATGEERYRDAATQVFRSLLIPVAEGGVLVSTPHGQAIEELPDEPPSFVLNGWLTALEIVVGFAERTRNPDALELVDSNLDLLERLLPLYDVPQAANSRYKLEGPAQIAVDLPDGARLVDASLEVPGLGRQPFVQGPEVESGQDVSTIDTGADGGPVLHAMLNMASYPEANTLRLAVEAAKPGILRLRLGQGDYQPLAWQLPVLSWSPLLEAPLPRGRTELDVAVPWSEAELVAYPTNFLKKVEGRPCNAYHFIHIKGLRAIARLTDRPIFADYARRWAAYVERWPELPAYARGELKLDGSCSDRP